MNFVKKISNFSGDENVKKGIVVCKKVLRITPRVYS